MILSPSSVFTPTSPPLSWFLCAQRGSVSTDASGLKRWASPPPPASNSLLSFFSLRFSHTEYKFAVYDPAGSRDCPLAVYLMQLSVFFFKKREKFKSFKRGAPDAPQPTVMLKSSRKSISFPTVSRSRSYFCHFCLSRRFSRPRIWQRK